MLPWLTETSPARFHDLRDTALSKLVKDDMLALILRGVLVPGQRINEPDVATRLGVSRVPVREALRELQSSGLVIARKHAGVFVRQLDASEISDLYQMRGLLDGFSGRCAAQLPPTARRTLTAVLDDCVASMREAAGRHEVQRYYSDNLLFHWTIVEAAGNEVLSESYRGIVQKLHLSRLQNLSRDIGIQASIAEHVDIVKALQEGDAQRSETLMQCHVSDAHQRLLIATAGGAPVGEPPIPLETHA